MKVVLILIFIICIMSGCVSLNTPLQSSEQVSRPSDIENVQLTYGAVKKYLVKEETTQAQIIKLFGSPNNMTIDSNKNELWIYDRVFAETISSGTSASGGGFLGVGGGADGVGAGIGVGGSSKSSESSMRSTNRTLTIIMEFNREGILTEYSAREGRY